MRLSQTKPKTKHNNKQTKPNKNPARLIKLSIPAKALANKEGIICCCPDKSPLAADVPQGTQPTTVTYFYVDQSLVILSITVFKALLGQVQLFLCIIKAFKLFQAEVAPHDVQLEDCIVVHSVQQLFALTTGEGSCHGAFQPFRGRQKAF